MHQPKAWDASAEGPMGHLSRLNHCVGSITTAPRAFPATAIWRAAPASASLRTAAIGVGQTPVYEVNGESVQRFPIRAYVEVHDADTALRWRAIAR